MKQMKKPLWPAWFPYPSSWLSALTLSLLLSVVIVVARITGFVGYVLARLANSPEILAIFGTLALLSPIPTIALAHHLLHLFLRRFIPAIQAPEIGEKGLIPGLMSWWEGLYGWLVIILSTLTAFSLCTVILLIFNLSYEKITYTYTQAEINIQTISAVLYIVIASGLYQIEYLVKYRLFYAKSITRKPINTTLNPNIDSTLEVGLNQLRGEMGLTKMKRKGKSV